MYFLINSLSTFVKCPFKYIKSKLTSGNFIVSGNSTSYTSPLARLFLAASLNTYATPIPDFAAFILCSVSPAS